MRDTYTPQDINPPADGCEPDEDELDLAESFIQARKYTDELADESDYRCTDAAQQRLNF